MLEEDDRPISSPRCVDTAKWSTLGQVNFSQKDQVHLQ